MKLLDWNDKNPSVISGISKMAGSVAIMVGLGNLERILLRFFEYSEEMSNVLTVISFPILCYVILVFYSGCNELLERGWIRKKPRKKSWSRKRHN